MLSLPTPSVYQAPKCFVTYGTMAHVEPKQLPTKGKPWAPILGQGFNHKVELILPQECCEVVHQKLVKDVAAPTFHRVIMTLGQVLDGAFFNEYIKRGNILMLSEGRTTVENVFSLREGLLTMFLDKETYERAGLVGKPHGVKGKRGLKPRWVVSYQLRDPSMLHGKKGFDRLIYACKNALNTPVTWLFCNAATTAPSPDPLNQYFPTRYTCEPALVSDMHVQTAPLAIPNEVIQNGDRPDLEDFATETYEWLSLIRLRSPRVDAEDNIDPYLSRYRVPGGTDADTPAHSKVCKITWQGFFTSDWVRSVLINALVALPSRAWVSLSATSFSKGMAGDSSEALVEDGVLDEPAQLGLALGGVEVLSFGQLLYPALELGVDLFGTSSACSMVPSVTARPSGMGGISTGGAAVSAVVVDWPLPSVVAAAAEAAILCDLGVVGLALDLLAGGDAVGALGIDVGTELLNKALCRIDGFDDEQGRLFVLVPQVNIDAEFLDQGAQELEVVVACGCVDEGVAVLILARGDGRVLAEQRE
ncbi:ribonuclease P protein subunit p40 [Colletotrichum liriopes]|uniref:Ribonuclease P protein subunit p40 n=1 Tax=Colletotrichum liriopes TaxID=708192 RepID=A0AA37GHE0_9PEZI|nr:ribonuclease P protein subunit p40 [Colletotrichum liriopes]